MSYHHPQMFSLQIWRFPSIDDPFTIRRSSSSCVEVDATRSSETMFYHPRYLKAQAEHKDAWITMAFVEVFCCCFLAAVFPEENSS